MEEYLIVVFAIAFCVFLVLNGYLLEKNRSLKKRRGRSFEELYFDEKENCFFIGGDSLSVGDWVLVQFKLDGNLYLDRYVIMSREEGLYIVSLSSGVVIDPVLLDAAFACRIRTDVFDPFVEELLTPLEGYDVQAFLGFKVDVLTYLFDKKKFVFVDYCMADSSDYSAGDSIEKEIEAELYSEVIAYQKELDAAACSEFGEQQSLKI